MTANPAATASTSTSTSSRLVVIVIAIFLFGGIGLTQLSVYLEVADPYLARSGDGANILSFVAARLEPERFAADPLLSDPASYDFYRTATTTVVSLAAQLGVQDLALVYLSLAVPAILLHGLGFWLLGMKLGLRPWAALAGSVALLATVPAIVGTYWGGFGDPQPRFLFQSVLPFVLILAWIWRNRPPRWPLVMLAAGLATYVHPVSGPPVALGLLLALVIGPSAGALRYRLAWSFAAGAVFLVTVAPFAANFLGATRTASVVVDPAFLIAAARDRFASPYLDPAHAFLEVLRVPWAGWHGIVAVLALAGTAIVRLRAGALPQELSFLMRLIAAFFMTTVVLPLAEVALSLAVGRYPLQLDFVRASRYLVPLMLMAALVLAANHLPRVLTRRSQAVAVVVVVFWLAVSPVASGLGQGAPLATALQAGHCVVDDCTDAGGLVPFHQLFRFLRDDLPPGTPIYSTDGDVTIRYAARQPLVFSDKDGGAFIYSKSPATMTWYRHFVRQRNIALIDQEPARVRAYLGHAEETGAAYAVLPASAATACNLTPVFGNARFLVVEVASASVSC